MKRIVFALISLVACTSARAQQRLELAPVASFDFGSPLFINRAPDVLNTFGGNGNGTSSSESYGVGVQGIVPEWIAPHFDLLGRLQAVYTTGHFAFDAVPVTISGSEAKLLFEAGASWDASPIAINAGTWISQAIVRNVSAGSSYTHAGLFAGIGWKIPDFPIRPELSTHLDLTELSNAGSNAWSVGISLSYDVGKNNSSERHTAITSSGRDTLNSRTATSVKFLVDGAEVHGNPPLDREELHVTQYTMVDAPNTSPTVDRWIKRSYHLPKLSIIYSNRGRATLRATLRVTSGQKQLFYKSLDGNSQDGTSIEPLEDSEWQRSILQLRSEDTNRLVAELKLDTQTVRDTLLFPPADSTTASTIITKHESRFRLLTNFGHTAGGNQVVELLLERMQALMEENPAITVSTPSVTEPLLIRLRTIIADWDSMKLTENPNSKYVIVTFDY